MVPEDEVDVPSRCLDDWVLSMGLMSHDDVWSGWMKTPMEAACTMTLEYSLLEGVGVERVFEVDAVVTLSGSGVASFGGVGGKLNMACETEDSDGFWGDLMGTSSEPTWTGLKGEHHEEPEEPVPFWGYGSCFPSEAPIQGCSGL